MRRRLLKNPAAVAGMLILLAFVLAALLAATFSGVKPKRA